MVTRIRSLLTGIKVRSTERHLTAARFCDSCAQACDATCRSDAYLRHTGQAVSSYGYVR